MDTYMDLSGDKRFEEALKLLDGRRYVEAVTAFSELVALSPDMTGAYGNRGLAFLNLGLENEARADFETVLKLDPYDAMGHCMLAEISRFSGTPEETLEHVNRAFEVDKDEPQALFIRGWLFARAGQYDVAVEDLDRFLDLADDRDTQDIEDLYDACMHLATDGATGSDGKPLDTEERRNEFLGQYGWSFDYRENERYVEMELPCKFAHCIRNRPPLAQGTLEGCPVFGTSCPGGGKQVCWCTDNPPFM